MQRVSAAFPEQPPEERRQPQPGEAEAAAKQKPPFSEGEALRLAQRYFLSPAVAREAREVFMWYRAMEQQLRQRRGGATLTPSTSSRKATAGATVSSGTTLQEGGADGTPNRLDVPCGEKAAEATLEWKREGGKSDGQTAWTPASVSRKSTFLGDGQQRQLQGEVELEAEGTTNSEACKGTGEEETLGVEGLQQFFKDLGVRMSALEVADMVHTLNDDPIDFVLRRRAMAAAAAAAAEAAAQASDLGVSSAGQGASTKSAASSKAAPGRRKDNPTANGGGKEFTAESDWASYRGRELSLSLGRRPTRDGVTFSTFLFILSHVLLEKDDTTEMRNCEVHDLFQLLDTDGDGAVSVRDVQTVIRRLIGEGAAAEDRDLQKLCAMSMVELEAALMECDVDGDGRVTLDDMYGVLRS
ncbi:uncharacterized protein Tco025E_00177 [Trypanosoma conorhini]|uniref:EF-hand domain-containing protein n=1 Tax=Trypanosoma conorhini TaxID=83891 RepID=A0A422QCJ3_9TRYP|nr:uncharacterized protein Tco025E_00177 [Trypanosoma conorhini]RNF27616.1 hypothetical protein Tco025E_00177 [Trypanosoma conorhini]